MQSNYMFPHEFLYIVANSKPRSELIEDLFSVKKSLVKHKVHNFEFLNKKTLETEHLDEKMTKLHRLFPGDFIDNRPQHLMSSYLDRDAEG